MSPPKFTASLAKEYSDLFNRCKIALDKMTEVEGVVQRILDFRIVTRRSLLNRMCRGK
jgi:lysozyme family protein